MSSAFVELESISHSIRSSDDGKCVEKKELKREYQTINGRELNKLDE